VQSVVGTGWSVAHVVDRITLPSPREYFGLGAEGVVRLGQAVWVVQFGV
jgi:hypothetical protein